MSVALGTDREADRVFSMARVDSAQPVNLYELTYKLMGTVPLVGGDCDRLARVRGGCGWRVEAMATRPERIRWTCAVLLARWWCLVGARQTNERALAAAILAPFGQWLDAMADCGEDLHELSESFGVSQSFALLRIGEVRSKFAAVRRHDGLIIFSGNGCGVRSVKLQHLPIDDEILPRVGLLSA